MINDLSDLRKLLKLCRAHGVTEIDLGTLSMKLGDMPESIHAEVEEDANQKLDEAVGMPALPEELHGMDPMAFYSAGSAQ